VARQGGDEFLVLLADLEATDEGAASRMVAEASERIARSVAEPGLKPATLSVRASIGSAMFPFEAGDARSMLQFSDAQMYAQKRERRQMSTEVHRLG
jgi:diguanylate cyclase (GGDEF)-like protein